MRLYPLPVYGTPHSLDHTNCGIARRSSSHLERYRENKRNVASFSTSFSMMGLPSSHSIRKTRRSAPKTKTGCRTCKRRRVKCGEERPRCLRCINLANGSGDCEYPLGSTATKQRALLPQVTFNTPSKTNESSPKRKSQELVLFPYFSRFKSQQEYQYHNFFCTEVANELAAFSPSDLWQRSVLQAAETEPFIHDVVMAVAALYKINREAPHMRPSDAHQVFKNEHAFAVKEYQKSLACMRDAISSGKMDVRTALIACLLTICFENAYGRKDLALLNCQSGSRLRRKFSVPLLNNSSSHQDSSGNASSTSYMIEDELVAVFSRLDISAMIFVNGQTADEHRMFKDELDDMIRKMPSKFNSMEEAIAYGNIIMNRCWHFINIVQSLDSSPIRLPQEHEPGSYRRWAWCDLRYGSNPWIGTDEEIPMQWRKETADCSMELQRWSCAFHPLWRKYKHSFKSAPKEFFQATLLSLQALSTYVSVKGCIYRRETDWDIHVPEFDKIVARAEAYLLLKPKHYYLSFEGETVIYLYYVLWKCRDGAIRRRVLKLLDEHPRREGSWDAGHSASVGRWLMSLEEGQRGEVECQEISEEDRVRLLGTDFDTVEGQLHTWGFRLRNGEHARLSHQWPQ